MHIMLYRTYGPEGVNGELYINGARECYTIELPWVDNHRDVSCIPEGTYVLEKRYSVKHGWHLHVTGVRGRHLVLVHPANDAGKELKGCIAPVTQLTGPGKGILSRMAFERLKEKVFTQAAGKRFFSPSRAWNASHHTRPFGQPVPGALFSYHYSSSKTCV